VSNETCLLIGTVQDLLQQASTSFAEESTKAILQKWEDRFVLLLIEKYGECKHLFGKPKTSKKEVFEKIASAFSEAADVVVSGEQCMRKWLKLEAKYKEVEDNNKRTGRANQTWKFHDQIAECIGDSQRVNPAYTFDTEIDSSSSTTSCNDGGKSSEVNSDDDDSDDLGDCQGKRSKTLKNRRRKRKNYSSAAEMLSFLQSYTEKKEKAEEEKLKLLREMQQKKDEFFSQFLDVLKKK